MKSSTAKIHFNSSGTPVADDFDDVYFSNDSGIDETGHVFIQGNDLHERWAAWTSPAFIIAETGFGTGLNCLVAMAEFAAFREANPQSPLTRLYLVSTEKFPLRGEDIERAYQAFPSLKPQVDVLLSQYPVTVEGCHRLKFDAFSTTLDLWLGDIHDTLPQWHIPDNGLIDAWFLDGFAPSKNPDMWTDALFSQMARVTKAGGTFATFTAAGVVKRGLKAAGFAITKRNGFGRKRDMLTGTLDVSPDRRQHAPLYQRFGRRLVPGDNVAVVGAGLAGACMAHALVEKGLNVTLYCDDETPATGASGNRQGGLYPQLHASVSPASLIQAHCFLYAVRQYQPLVNEGSVPGEFCGVLQLAFNASQADRQHKLAENGHWPETLIQALSTEQASDVAGLPMPCQGLFIPAGGWLSPPHVVSTLLRQAEQTGRLEVKWKKALTTVQNNEPHHVELAFEDGTTADAQHVVLACGHKSINLPDFDGQALRPVRGQVEAVHTDETLGQLTTVLCHKGYMTPQWEGLHALGSTYVKDDIRTDARQEETDTNLAVHRDAMSGADWLTNINVSDQSRAAVRLGVADHQPLAGPLYSKSEQHALCAPLASGQALNRVAAPSGKDISALTALGSRGLTTAPLLAETIASALCHVPLPLAEPLLNALHPLRFAIRDAVRRQGDQ